MKVFHKILPVVLFAAAALHVQAQQTKITLQNRTDLKRSDELITLERTFLEKKLGKLSDKSGITVSDGKTGHKVLQFEDTNADGKWDQLVFLQSFKPAEEVVLNFSLNDPQSSAAGVLAHVRQMRKNSDDSFGPALPSDTVPAGQPNTDFTREKLPPFLTEGPAWENDKVGFRIYMDVRNIKDIWGKTTPKMMMDTVGVDPKLIYHHLAPWGMDILAVGKSLGAGSLALSVPRKGKTDTLVRLGGPNMGKIIYKRIADGPVRAVFSLSYPEWNVLGDGKLTRITEEISIWGGQYFYESKVSLSNAPAGAKLVTGIVNLKSRKKVELGLNKTKVMFTFDQQSEHGDHLGMAVAVKEKNFAGFGQTPNDTGDIRNTYIALMQLTEKKPVIFRYYAAWEHSDPVFATEEGFKAYLIEKTAASDQEIIIR
ncbi:DUF4861 family protein [Pedobacter sp. AW31-3R]|uniref:DUF4861 family protein n=1 Tax=Pedobacter sp. AW31-3R TaxID=3445781 RepID=UPI003FA06A85